MVKEDLPSPSLYPVEIQKGQSHPEGLVPVSAAGSREIKTNTTFQAPVSSLRKRSHP